jgi:CheY-like chemotaxis protein
MMLDEDLPDYVKGDPVRIKQVLNNFLNNAIKFTELGFVELSARHLSSSADQTRIMLSVTDSGIGIPEDKLESIFESFSQVDASTTRKYGGTGLGLSICRKLAELMNGEIRVDSSLGSGSTFSLIVRFDLPKPEEIPSDQEDSASGLIVDGPSKQLALEIAEAQKLDNSPEKRYSQEEDFDLIFDTPITPMGEQVLIVEDNRINQRLLLKFLSKLNLNAVVAQNGVEAVEFYCKHPFPIILMDCQMPIMDGYTATGEILKLAAQMGHQPVIIALTANAMPSDRQKCLNAGMHDYLPKPITLASLREVLESNGLRIFQDA